MIDGNLLTREGVAEILRKQQVDAFTAAADVADAVRIATEVEADAVLVNASTVDLGTLTDRIDSVAVIAFGVRNDAAAIIQCIELQLAGFLLETEPVQRLVSLIATARADVPQCPPTVVPLLLRLVAQQARVRSEPTRRLTAREREVLELLRHGHANKEIAVRLGISTRTVKNHLHNLYEKLQVHTRGEATATAGRSVSATPA